MYVPSADIPDTIALAVHWAVEFSVNVAELLLAPLLASSIPAAGVSRHRPWVYRATEPAVGVSCHRQKPNNGLYTY